MTRRKDIRTTKQGRSLHKHQRSGYVAQRSCESMIMIFNIALNTKKDLTQVLTRRSSGKEGKLRPVQGYSSETSTYEAKTQRTVSYKN